jgi:hypothetical protein
VKEIKEMGQNKNVLFPCWKIRFSVMLFSEYDLPHDPD